MITERIVNDVFDSKLCVVVDVGFFLVVVTLCRDFDYFNGFVSLQFTLQTTTIVANTYRIFIGL